MFNVEFVVSNPGTDSLEPMPSLNMQNVEGILPPAVGDLIPTQKAVYIVKQRAYIIERSALVVGKLILTYNCVLERIAHTEREDSDADKR